MVLHDRRKLVISVAVGLVVVSIGARALFSAHQESTSANGMALSTLASPATVSPAPQDQPGASSSPVELVVDVRGAVARPGVYHLAQGARVCDLLAAAGGPAANADLAAVNPAARLQDGQQVIVPREGEPVGGGVPSSGAAGAPSAGPVNLNTATPEQLDTLPGVGPATAQKIVDYRARNGGFRSIEDLKNVPGIGDARFETLRELVTV